MKNSAGSAQDLQSDFISFQNEKYRVAQSGIFKIAIILAIPLWSIWILFDYYFAPNQYIDFVPIRIGGIICL